MVTLEVDYTTIGVQEIIFIDQRRRRVRILRKRHEGYDEAMLTDGELAIETMGGVKLNLDWLFQEPRPDELEIIKEWLSDQR